MPGSRPGIGVGSYDQGFEYYEACLRYSVAMNVTAAEVRDIGLNEVARIKELMNKVCMVINGLHKVLLG